MVLAKTAVLGWDEDEDELEAAGLDEAGDVADFGPYPKR